MCKWRNMVKQGLLLLLSVAMVMSSVDMTAFAEEAVVEVASELADLGTFSIEAQGGVSLLSEADGTIELKDGNYENWIDRIDIPKCGRTIYEKLEEYCDNDGKDDLLISDASFSENSDSYKKITFSNIGERYINSIELVSLTPQDISDPSYIYKVIRAAFDAFLMDHPEVFWLNGSTNAYYMTSYLGNTVTGYTFYLITKIYDSGDYAFDMRGDEYTNATAIRNDIEVRKTAVNTILNTDAVKSAKNDYEKIKALNEWLTTNNEYNTLLTSGVSSYGTFRAHNCLSALTGSAGANGPVCEGYAEAFKILCNQLGIPCVLVTGNANGEAHAWNYTKVGGSWYGVDVTWNDPFVRESSGKVSGSENENYLLVGSSTLYEDTSFISSHMVTNCVSSSGVSFVNGPVLSEGKYIYAETETPKTYTISWDTNGDGIIDDTTTVAYGDIPTHTDGYKAPTAQYTYTFTGWSPSVASVTGDKTYTAVFEKTEIQPKPDEPKPEEPKEDPEPEQPAVSEVHGINRVAGDNRYETGLAVAETYRETLGVDKFKTAIIATGKSFADALPGSYLAYVKEAPILLTNEKEENMEIIVAYIKEHVEKNGMVYILGGEAAVSLALDDILKGAGYTVDRLAGGSRYETNLMILDRAEVTEGEIIVATGRNFADSLSASAAKLPILMVKDSLNVEQKVFLDEMNPSKIYIVGGEGAVNSSIAEELRNYSGEVERVAGNNRRETSVKIAKEFFKNPKAVVMASAKNFPDGLCGGPLAAVIGAPLILTVDNNITEAKNYITENNIEAGYLLGGESALKSISAEKIFN